jgi:hypothetical protein
MWDGGREWGGRGGCGMGRGRREEERWEGMVWIGIENCYYLVDLDTDFPEVLSLPLVLVCPDVLSAAVTRFMKVR